MTDGKEFVKLLKTSSMLRKYLLCYLLILYKSCESLLFKFQHKSTSSFKVYSNKSPFEIASTEFSGRGCVLVSQQEEYDRFMSKSVVFIFEHNSRGTQGVIVNKVSNY